MKRIWIILFLIVAFTWAEAQKNIIFVSFRGYGKGLGKKAGEVSLATKKALKNECRFASSKELYAAMAKFYKGKKLTRSFLYKSLQINASFRKWLQKRKVHYIIIGGVLTAKKQYGIFMRTIPVSPKHKGDRKFLRNKNWTTVKKDYLTNFLKTNCYKALKALGTKKIEPKPALAKGWFSEKLPKGLKKLKSPGLYSWQKDKSTMVYVPVNEFDYNDGAGNTETRKLNGYYIDKYEVTNNQYCKFLNATKPEDISKYIDLESNFCCIEKSGSRYRPKINASFYPVVEVSWHGAQAYCKWVGKKLPAADQWGKALKGGKTIPDWKLAKNKLGVKANSLTQRNFSWGDDDPNYILYRCNYKPEKLDEDGYKWLAPVIAFEGLGDSPYGCTNMIGNVWEWCEDDHKSEDSKICRGGSWSSDLESLKSSFHWQEKAHATNNDLGFRCVLNNN